MEREKTIIKVSIQGLFVNTILAAFKAVVGLMANSIAIILDAVNNLTDAFSQIVTIAGTKLSTKKPDKKHPYGYGRVEYLSSAIVAAVVLFAGFTALKESLQKIFQPQEASYTSVSFIILAVAVVVKFSYGIYVRHMGKKVESPALVAAGTDGFYDSLVSLSTIIGAVLSTLIHINIEGYLGCAISILIIRSGLEIMKESLGTIIGDRTDSEFAAKIKQRIKEFDGVRGAYDLILHDYGPSRSIASVHIEVDESMTADKIFTLTRTITAAIYQEFKIVITIGIYSSSSDPEVIDMQKEVTAIASSHPNVLQIHAFYVNHQAKAMLFDMLISYKEKNPDELIQTIKKEVQEKYPQYHADINLDHDFTD